MKSAQRGTPTSGAEVTNVSSHGLWLLVGDRERFLGFGDFPWFRDAPIGKVLNVELPAPGHLYWPDLDVDLDVESIEHPDRFPLVSYVPQITAPGDLAWEEIGADGTRIRHESEPGTTPLSRLFLWLLGLLPIEWLL